MVGFGYKIASLQYRKRPSGEEIGSLLIGPQPQPHLHTLAPRWVAVAGVAGKRRGGSTLSVGSRPTKAVIWC